MPRQYVYVGELLKTRAEFLAKYGNLPGMEADLHRLMRMDESYQTDILIGEVQERLRGFLYDLVELRREPPAEPGEIR